MYGICNEQLERKTSLWEGTNVQLLLLKVRILEAIEHIDSNPRFPLERVVSIRVFIQALNKCLCPLTVCL